MKLDFLGVAIFGGILLIGLTVIICFIGVGILIMKALIKYINHEMLENKNQSTENLLVKF